MCAYTLWVYSVVNSSSLSADRSVIIDKRRACFVCVLSVEAKVSLADELRLDLSSLLDDNSPSPLGSAHHPVSAAATRQSTTPDIQLDSPIISTLPASRYRHSRLHHYTDIFIYYSVATRGHMAPLAISP